MSLQSSLNVGFSDFKRFDTVRVIISADVRILSLNDEITLEYDDKVRLAFIPDNPDLVSGLQSLGEFIRDTAVVNIIDNDCELHEAYLFIFFLTVPIVLEINFEQSDYDFTEDSSCTLISTITLQYRTPQESFRVTFSPMTVDEFETEDLGFFINSRSDTIGSSSRATRGMCIYKITLFHQVIGKQRNPTS